MAGKEHHGEAGQCGVEAQGPRRTAGDPAEVGAAIGMVRLPCDLQAYYQRKVAEGKPKMVVLNAMRNKIIHRIYAVIGRGEPYRVDYTPVMQLAALDIL